MGGRLSPPANGPNGNWIFYMSAVDDRLYLSGDIAIMGNVRTREIVGWDGDRFLVLDTGLNYKALDVVSWRGRHIATGGFPYLASWDGSGWTPIYVEHGCRELCVFHDQLIAAKGAAYRDNTSDIQPGAESDGPSQYIATFNDTVWSPLGSGLNGDVKAMIVFGNRLVVAGSFTLAGGQPASRIAAWDGLSWSPIGAGLPATVTSLAVVDSHLVAVGQFNRTCLGDDIAIWNDTTGWSIHGTATPYRVRQSTVLHDTLFAVLNYRAAYFDGADWTYLNDPAIAKGTVEAIEVFRGDLVIGGLFVSERSRFEWTMAFRADGMFHLPPGNAVGRPHIGIQSLIKFHDRLVAVGTFESVGGAEADAAAAWDGTKWSNFGYPGAWQVYSPVVIGERLYAVTGGDFRVRSWNGVKWLDLPEPPSRSLRLASYQNELVAIAGNYLVKWNGITWVELSHDLPASSSYQGDLVEWNGKLVVAGPFTTIDGVAAPA